MYTVSKGPSKIVHKTRRDGFETCHLTPDLPSSRRFTLDTYNQDHWFFAVPSPYKLGLASAHHYERGAAVASGADGCKKCKTTLYFGTPSIGITQNLERLENSRDYTKKWVESQSDPSSPDDWTVRIDKPVFHTNGKKSNSSRAHQEAISPQHEEIIKFIHESWNSVCKDCEGDGDEEVGDRQQQASPSPSIVYYNESEPNHHLQDFKPFDLESWWGKRLFNTITKSIP